MKIVDDWKECWRWYSMHTSFVGFIFTSIASSLVMSGAAASWFGMFDIGVVLGIAAAIFAANMVGRLIIQKTKLERERRKRLRDEAKGKNLD